ncbi:Peptidyl-prolyl cis-trans isomerase [Alloactinosynnema sp. L-07]|uniref:peptidylprolyl isomerase n=1 Tax=Alloactinosynnema sp. L-07 TaxID=1653480 RepID=UPI00065F0016|nr:peptidylprolyl isomerase [Alloactinosynnema sp. L-07]CRK58108.1 Peptidyl-prolyl cis-trans isomerase [Alloactinosynnema sp. L-07]
MSRTALTGVLLVALAGCSTATSGNPVGADSTDGSTTTTAAAASSASGSSSGSTSKTSAGDGKACRYATATGQPAPDGRDVGKPAERAKDAPAKVTLTTNLGAVGITLATDTAPCTARSFLHLSSKKFYDDTPCHRLTSADSLKVLQCGDPTGKGIGGPGYTVPDENPGTLKPSGVAEAVIYPRGTVAMANTGRPNSGGSQFFLVYADSMLPPTYAVFGTIDDAGLAVLDKVANGGITPQRGEQDGAPTVPVKIQTAKTDG